MTERANEHEELIRRYLNAFNERDRETMSELLADDVVEHGLGRELHGYEEIEEFLDAHFETFPDYSGRTDVLISEDDTVAVRYTVSGTHTGEYLDVEPSGRTVEWSGIAMYRIEGDEIAEIWIEEDRLGLLEQLEVLDPPAHLRL
ncbi:ester cyclase [Natronorarus salvus]|uniref:ester cyclase n=1 Tax=Natronorarus salvus TaxID=3117733 RepID=UPI002F263156